MSCQRRWAKNNFTKEKTRKAKLQRVNRTRYNAIKLEWMRNNPEYAFFRKTLTRIEQSQNSFKYEDLLGYNSKTFRGHIESLWLPGMSWDNRSEWHIDHIKPIKKFIEEDNKNLKEINALSNLQPLWAKDNLSKGSKYEEEYIED